MIHLSLYLTMHRSKPHWFIESIKTKDDQGRLPIHIACMHKAPLPILTRLVDEDTSSLLVLDHEHRSPLAIACKHACCYATVKMLLKQYPEAALIEDAYGLVPIELERRYGGCRSPIVTLLRSRMMLGRRSKTWHSLESRCSSLSSSSRRPSYDQYHEDGSKHIETWTHVSKPAVVLSCEICASKNRKLQSRPPAGLEYVKKKHSRCGHYYFELTTCRSIFLKKAYESGVIL